MVISGHFLTVGLSVKRLYNKAKRAGERAKEATREEEKEIKNGYLQKVRSHYKRRG